MLACLPYPCPPPTFTPSEGRMNENCKRQNSPASQFCPVLGRTAVGLSPLEALGVEGCCSLKVLLSPAHIKVAETLPQSWLGQFPVPPHARMLLLRRLLWKCLTVLREFNPGPTAAEVPSQRATPAEFSKALGCGHRRRGSLRSLRLVKSQQ